MSHATPALSKYAGIPVTLLTDEDGRVFDWYRNMVRFERKIPGSNHTIEQVDGYTPWRLETRVMLPDSESWRAFSRSRGFVGEFRHVAHPFAELDGATIFAELGSIYAIWPAVWLESIDDRSVRKLRDGRVVARVTFRRESTEVYGW